MNLGRMRLFACLWLAGAFHAQAEGLSLESAGTRGGFSKRKHADRFQQIEAFVNWNAPWRWDYDCGWHIQTRLDLTSGWISGRGDDAYIGTFGPTFELGRNRFPLVFELGSSPTILSRKHFGNTDFGTLFQFTTHGSVLWRAGSRLTVEARLQHMSNANIGPSNPGLNMFLLGVGWRF
jgi:hypothetical protein